MFPGFFCSSQFCQKNQLFKSKMWCVFLKINQKVVEACVVVLLSQATLIFLDSLNLSRLSSSQEILKVRVDLSHALYLVVLNCKEHDFTRQTSLQVSLAINHTILLENLVASTLKLLFLIFEFGILIFRRIRGIYFRNIVKFFYLLTVFASRMALPNARLALPSGLP